MTCRVSQSMIGSLSDRENPRRSASNAFSQALETFTADKTVSIVCHFDADGLSSAALLTRALRAAGWQAEPLVIGKGETPWDEQVRARIAGGEPGGIVLVDLGTRPEPVLPGVPAVIIDHHVPTGTPQGAVTISGNGLDPEPTSALIAWWAAGALGDQDDLLWLAAIGLIGDMAEDRSFPELTKAQARWGKTALRDAVSLINAPRRTTQADATPALRLLLQCDGPKAITKGTDPDAVALHEAKREVREAMENAKRAPPRIAGDVALIELDSPCQIHPLIAQQWRSRLRDKIVIAANKGYRPGWVHFATRSASGRDLIAFLADHRPPGADGRYGNGHTQATGGALRLSDWNSFLASLGLTQTQVPA